MEEKSLNFSLLYPMGNLTALINNDKGQIPKDKYSFVSKQIIETKILNCEQVGFYENKDDYIELSMMGGELCINAVRSLGYLVCKAEKIDKVKIKTKEYDIDFEVSLQEKGTEVKFDIELTNKKINNDLHIVEMSGISFFIEHFPYLEINEQSILNRFDKLKIQYDKFANSNKAIGYIPYSEGLTSDCLSIRPLVTVNETQTTIFETACGSGTIAISSHKSLESKLQNFSIKQPSGANFHVNYARKTDNISSITLKSEIKLLASGQIFVNELFEII